MTDASLPEVAEGGPKVRLQTEDSLEEKLFNQPDRRRVREQTQAAEMSADSGANDTIPSRSLPKQVVIIEAGFPVSRRLEALVKSGLLSASEQTAVVDVNDDFIEEVKDAEINEPSEDAYFNRWRSALNAADERLRLLVGWDRFNQLSALAAQKAMQSPK